MKKNQRPRRILKVRQDSKRRCKTVAHTHNLLPLLFRRLHAKKNLKNYYSIFFEIFVCTSTFLNGNRNRKWDGELRARGREREQDLSAHCIFYYGWKKRKLLQRAYILSHGASASASVCKEWSVFKYLIFQQINTRAQRNALYSIGCFFLLFLYWHLESPMCMWTQVASMCVFGHQNRKGRLEKSYQKFKKISAAIEYASSNMVWTANMLTHTHSHKSENIPLYLTISIDFLCLRK